MIEDSELLEATIALAVADGELRRSEWGVVETLAKRVGVGQASLDAMVDAARNDDSFAQNVFVPPDRVHHAIVLLVGQARIDGRISDEERRVIVRISQSLGLAGDAFREAYEEGLKRADTIRRSRQA